MDAQGTSSEPADVATVGGEPTEVAASAAAPSPTVPDETAPGGEGSQPGATVAGTEPEAENGRPGFATRGRMRRRLRFLRKARELGYRDLGGLVFEMQRMGERHDELVAAKLGLLGAVDGELRALETALGDRRAGTVLREAGIAACPRCAAIHGSEDRFCPACGLAMNRHADLPIGAIPASAATPPVSPPAATATPPASPAAATSPSTTAVSPATPVGPAAPPSVPAAAPSVPSTPAAAAQPQSATAPDREPRAPTPPVGAREDDRPTEIIRPGEGER